MIRIIFDNGELLDCENVNRIVFDKAELLKEVKIIRNLEDDNYILELKESNHE